MSSLHSLAGRPAEIPAHLIEKALALTGKTMNDVRYIPDDIDTAFEFSIEKFGWYLLSPEFIEKYTYFMPRKDYRDMWACEIGIAIYEYQKGNEQPLISLLEKI